MRTSRLFALVALFAVWPAGAQAAGPWWGWLEELSGPGYFLGGGYDVRLFCVLDDASVTTCYTDRNPRTRGVVELRSAFLTSGNRQRLKDVPLTSAGNNQPVHAVRLEPVFYVRVHPTLDLGAGAGFIRLSGDGFESLYRLTVPMSVSFTPGAFAKAGDSGIRRWTRVFRVRLDGTYLTKGFVGADFGNAKSIFNTGGGEFRKSVSVVVDLESLIR